MNIKIAACLCAVRQERCVCQVVDFWAFSTEEGEWGREIMSMHHTRNALQRMTPQVRPRP